MSRVDIDRPGPTYTKDTLTDLRAAEPDAEWFFITGADALAAIMSWKDVDELFTLAHFIGVTRPGYTLHDLNLPDGSVTLIEVPALAISSTDCRSTGPRAARRSGTWCRTVSSSTSPNTACTQRKHEFDDENYCNTGRNMTATDTALTLARVAAQAAADKLAKDILLVDVSDRLAITDVFVIVTGANERQVGAIVDAVEEKMRAAGHQTAAPRGRTRRPLGAARLRRRRRARPALRGAGVLCAGPAVEGLPDDPVGRCVR